ncbi:VRR-NUC domain-containing protein [Rudanella paleaurantiibacter]|uniref:VRR-NUC domain-containing protein n=1 Tax=Rudanella paleaurantiibacter TaxID=2614655 RepID=A0A7J5U2A9_9BACT|nr:VRR-NUC domain-containing protein [Rudanella paleaurantiibacter]KAB7731923.1 VRR-NUC domain-containing protein [Rudanella paleaurantiibacter]
MSQQQPNSNSAIEHLCRLADVQKREKWPNVKPAYIPKAKYDDRTANGLTKCIVDFINLSGGMATHIQSQGQYRPGAGGQKGTFTYGSTRRGTADIHAVFYGKHLSVEVKIGKDRQSQAQKAVQSDVERAGGYYVIVRSFGGFYQWWTQSFLSNVILP